MAVANNRVFSPTGFQELFTILGRLRDAVLYAGGTGHIRYRDPSRVSQSIVSLDSLEELKKISRTESFIEIGSMVTLNRIIHLGKVVPEPLIRCIGQIGGPELRNLATIGGNICNPYERQDLSGPMIALDAQYELRSQQSSRWIQASRFSPVTTPAVFEGSEILTRVRVPLEPWTYTWYRKFKTPGGDGTGSNIILVLQNRKNILTGIRVVYSGRVILREKNSETMLAGKPLPLDRKHAADFVESWKNYLAGLSEIESPAVQDGDGNSKPEMVKTQILNFIQTTISRVSE